MKKFYMFFVVLFVVTASVASTTTPLMSEDEYRVGQGDIETSFLINPQFIRGAASADRFTMKLGANYFWDDIWAPGFEFQVAAGGGTTFTMLPNLKAYLPLDSRWMPYAQVGFGYMHSFGADFFALAIGPGINYLVANNVAIGAQLRYDLGLGSQTIHNVQIPIQFAIYFKY